MAMPTWEEVETVLDEIRPALRFDGGDVELVDIKEDGTVLVRMIGACSGCGMSVLTLKAGIERALKNRFPEIKEVKDVNMDIPMTFGF
ncbi:MAG: NifU family protein [Aquificaceae bacterium]|nr:NifU family protein [Aquificaceae bacterium]MCS7307095.1 NifU family protein [Aquificaceae bacterium]MDW8433704.1 NifU family protein [Aquificaceae bacterium]